jgi:hypothetical protein
MCYRSEYESWLSEPDRSPLTMKRYHLAGSERGHLGRCQAVGYSMLISRSANSDRAMRSSTHHSKHPGWPASPVQVGQHTPSDLGASTHALIMVHDDLKLGPIASIQ